jgi:hypothetical protein
VTVTEKITKHHPPGWCFFLPFQEIADVKAATFPICPLIKTKPAQTVLAGGTAPRKTKKTASVGNVFTLPHFFAQINQKFIQT